MGVATICIGDVHGCLTELKELCRTVGYHKGGKLSAVLLGDAVDRGPEPHGVIQFCIENNISMVIGNHEESIVSYINSLQRKANGEAITIRQLNSEQTVSGDQLTAEDINWIAKSPLWLKIRPNVVVVHAGFEAAYTLEDQSENCLRVKQVVEKTGAVSPKAEAGKPYTYSKEIPWYEAWLADKSNPPVIYGHQRIYSPSPNFNVHRWRSAKEMKSLPEGTKNWEGPWTCGIDTGVVYGGYLTGFLVDSMEIVQVRAKEEYWYQGRTIDTYKHWEKNKPELEGKGTGTYESGPLAKTALKITTRPISRKEDYRPGIVPEFSDKPYTPPTYEASKTIIPAATLSDAVRTAYPVNTHSVPVKQWEPPKTAIIRYPPRMPGVARRAASVSIITPNGAQVTPEPKNPDMPPTLGSIPVEERDFKAQMDKMLGVKPKEDFTHTWDSKGNPILNPLQQKAVAAGFKILNQISEDGHMTPPSQTDIDRAKYLN